MSSPAGRPDPRAFIRRVIQSWQRRRGTTPPAPDPTGFYRAADPGHGPRGAVLASEPLDAPAGAAAWRVRYRTLDAAGRPVAASMAVAAPAGLAPPPRPVVVWVHGAVGVAPGCGPSRSGFQAWYGDELLRRGVVVVAPDLTGLGVEGLTHPYLHGTTAGRSVLDAARAAAALPATGGGRRVALLGHSAGGHAVLWANQLAVGEDGAGLDLEVAIPLAPIGDLSVAMGEYARASGMAAFAVQLAATWPGVEPVEPAAVLTSAALDRLDHLRTDGLAGLVRVFGHDPARWVRADGFTTAAWSDALDRQSAGRGPGAAPVLVIHGEDDHEVPVAWARHLVERMQAGGQAVELRAYAGADHMTIHDAGRDDVLSRLLGALDAT